MKSRICHSQLVNWSGAQPQKGQRRFSSQERFSSLSFLIIFCQNIIWPEPHVNHSGHTEVTQMASSLPLLQDKGLWRNQSKNSPELQHGANKFKMSTKLVSCCYPDTRIVMGSPTNSDSNMSAPAVLAPASHVIFST